MSNTITNREQILVNGFVKERTATHIVIGSHGWETLCMQGSTSQHDEHGELIADATTISRGRLPVTCSVCAAIWRDVHGFTQADFSPSEQVSVYTDTTKTRIDLFASDVPDVEPKTANMSKSWDEQSVKLAGYISTLKEQNVSNEGEDIFADKNILKSGDEEHIKIIIEQGEKLLNLSQDSTLFGLNHHQDDKAVLIDHFSSDLEQFATERGLRLGGKPILLYAQSRIPEHALFHLAASSHLPNTYTTIDQTAGRTFSLYSVPFKIRLSLENKIKGIIGFKSINIIKKRGGKKVESYELPFAYILNELMYTNCLDLPCSLENIKNIYQWSCGFCHTGEKEPVWLSMKALETISPLFIYKYQKMSEVDVADLWHKYVLSEEYILRKLIDYKGFTRPLHYFKEGWSVQKLQTHLNTPEDQTRKYRRKDAKEITFNLSETELSEVSSYYCGRTKEHY